MARLRRCVRCKPYVGKFMRRGYTRHRDGICSQCRSEIRWLRQQGSRVQVLMVDQIRNPLAPTFDELRRARPLPGVLNVEFPAVGRSRTSWRGRGA